jgi:lambda family phage portal protein
LKQPIRLGLVDRMIAAVSPGAAVRRQQARMKLAGLTRARMLYDAASTGHRTAGWRPAATDANGEVRVAGERLRNIGREMVRNNAYAARALSVISSNVVGTGIIPTIESQNKRTVGKLEELLRDHFDTPACDYNGRTDLYGLQALAMRTIVESGEVLIRRRDLNTEERQDIGAPLPFQIQVLEPDYLDVQKDGPMEGDTVAIQGVEFNKKGRVVAYWLFNEHPGTTTPVSIQSERIPAEYVIHVFRADRPGQVRGVTWFAPVAMRMRDLSDYSDATLIRQKISNCFAAFVTSDQPDQMTVTSEDESTNELPLEYFEPGKIERLMPGETVEFPTTPSTAEFAPYATATLREIAAGLGVSYEALSGDLSGVNFSSGRMGWLEFQRNIDAWRNHMLVPQMLARIGRWFMDAARVSQGVSGSVKIKWTPPRREMISPADEVPHTVAMIRAGLISRAEVLRKSGYDPEIVDAEIAADNKRADSLDLVLDSDARHRTAVGNPTDPTGQAPAEGAEDRRVINRAPLRAA